MSRLPTRGAREASASMRKFMEYRASALQATRQAYLDTLVITLLESATYEEGYASHQEAYESGILDATRAAKNWIEGFPNETTGGLAS